jgi:signal transduction histidine kinase
MNEYQERSEGGGANPALPKDIALAAIGRAKADLDIALGQLEHLQVIDSESTSFAAHALNNYLTVIDGAVQLVSSMLPGVDPQISTLLSGIRDAGELMRHTVHQLMNLSAGDGQVYKRVEVDVPRLVGGVCDYYRRLAARKDIDIQFEVEVPGPLVQTDPVVLAAIMDNLLSNAVKYSPWGQTVYVVVRHEPQALVCSVRDEGPGISPADQRRLFQRGVPLSATPTGGEPSSGYGLAVAKELATKIEAELWYESPDMGGACFSLRLPRSPMTH